MHSALFIVRLRWSSFSKALPAASEATLPSPQFPLLAAVDNQATVLVSCFSIFLNNFSSSFLELGVRVCSNDSNLGHAHLEVEKLYQLIEPRGHHHL